MQSALHILALVSEMKQEISGGKIISSEFYKKERAAFIIIKTDKSKLALGFKYHPSGSGTFLIPASKISIDTKEKPWPIFKIENAVISGINQLGLDRLFRIEIGNEGAQESILIEAIGPNGNIWWLDADNHIKATLRNRKYDKDEVYTPPPPPDRLDPFNIMSNEIKERAGNTDISSMPVFLEKNILSINRTLAKEILIRADLDFVPPNELEDEEIYKLVNIIRELANYFKMPEKGYLYQLRSGIEVFPFKLKSTETTPEKYKTISLAIQDSTAIRQTIDAEEDQRRNIVDAVMRSVKKIERRLKKLEIDIENARDYEQYKKMGELLKINFNKVHKGMSEITLTDIYLDSSDILIKLDPSLSPVENADQYFKKYRKGREGLELLERRMEISRGELEELKEISNALDSDFDQAFARYEGEITNILPKEGVKKEGVTRLPYREHTLSTGLRIYIGRDGSDNDRTTFEFTKPYELWFHAQQCPGSHVVIKFPNKQFEPSKREITETAEIAAYHSKAKNDSLVPVIYTQRRYVRKPRKAKPGLVMVEREKSIMVQPKKPE